MAMIQCPECGKEISDKAKTCPRCGVPIYVCPECGRVSADCEGVCPHCGYEHVEKNPIAQNPKEEQSIRMDGAEKNDIITRWLKENPKEQKWCKPNGLFLNAIVFFVVAASVGIILCFYYFIQQPFETLSESDEYLEALELVLNYKVYIRNVWILAVCLCILWVVLVAIYLYRDLWVIRCKNWMKTKKINAKEALKKESIEFQEGVFSGIKKWDGYQIPNAQRAYMYDSALYNNNVGYIFNCFFRVIVCISVFILFISVYTIDVCDMIEKNAILGMQISVFDETLVFSMPWIGGLLGALVLCLIILLVIRTQEQKQIRSRFHQALSK